MSHSIKFLSGRLSSFKYAFNGLKVLFTEEPNALIHLVLTIGVVTIGFMVRMEVWEWVAIIFSIGVVFTMEILNTTIENICDFVSPEKHLHIKKIKDLAAASVLVSSLMAIAVGLIIFIPKFF